MSKFDSLIPGEDSDSFPLTSHRSQKAMLRHPVRLLEFGCVSERLSCKERLRQPGRFVSAEVNPELAGSDRRNPTESSVDQLSLNWLLAL